MNICLKQMADAGTRPMLGDADVSARPGKIGSGARSAPPVPEKLRESVRRRKPALACAAMNIDSPDSDGSEDPGTPVPRRRRRRALLIAVSVAALVAAGAGIEAIASIPDAHGVIHGCYSKSSGALRVIDSAKRKCPRGTKALNWNRRGPRGLRGPRGSLATTPINVSYTATRATAHQLTADNVNLLLECGDNRIGADAANVAVYAQSTHGVTTITETTSGSTSTTSEQIDAENGSAVALGDAYVGGSYLAGSAYFDGVLELSTGAIDYLHIWWTRDTRQNHPVCAFQGSVVETGKPRIVPS